MLTRIAAPLYRVGFAAFLVLGFATVTAPSQAATIWDETIAGDLSSDAAAPTSLSIGLGANTITGVVSAGLADTRDYITFTIAAGQQLSGLLLQQWEDVIVGGPANTGFHAINLGATSFVPSASTIGSFLGGAHLDFAPAGTDLLPNLAAAPQGGTGFTTPLDPGTYSYVVQQTGGQRNRYALDLVVIPEPTTALLLGLGLASLTIGRRRD